MTTAGKIRDLLTSRRYEKAGEELALAIDPFAIFDVKVFNPGNIALVHVKARNGRAIGIILDRAARYRLEFDLRDGPPRSQVRKVRVMLEGLGFGERKTGQA